MLIRDPSQDIARVLFSEDAIADRVRDLADELTERFRGERPVLVCVLKGAAFFFVDLCRRMDCPLDMDFKSSVIAVLLGVLLAGIIMGAASAGLFGAVGAMFA